MWYAITGEDPYIEGGVYRDVTVKPFNLVFP